MKRPQAKKGAVWTGRALGRFRTVFPKDTHEWLRWIDKDRALYLDKKEVLSLLSNPRHPEDVVNSPTLKNKIRGFKNPPINKTGDSANPR